MRSPSQTSSADVYVRLGIAHAAAVQADPEARTLAEPMRQATERVRDAAHRRGAARENATILMTMRERADYEADKFLRLLETETLLLSGRDRRRSPYRELFPDGITEVVGAPLPEQLDRMRTIELHLADIPSLSKHGEALAAVRGALEDAVRAHMDAVRQESETAAALLIAKTDWRRQYRASYGMLLGVFGDRRRVESYFPEHKERRERESPDAPVPPDRRMDDTAR